MLEPHSDRTRRITPRPATAAKGALLRCSYEAGGLGALVQEIRQASENISAGDARMNQRLDGIERSVNELYLKANHPGATWETKDDEVAERKDAMGLCYNRRALTIPKIDADVSDNYTPTSAEVDQALIHRKAIKALFRHGDATRLEPTFQKSLSAFSFGARASCSRPSRATRSCAALSIRPTSPASSIV